MPYLPPTSHATLFATMRRERLLPLAGAVTVQPRQRVEAADVVARTFVADRHYLVDVGRKLGLPDDQADAALLKKDGDPVKAGEPIAARKGALGLGRRLARSPADGQLVAAAGGKALVAAISKPFELRAGIPGQVVTILQSRGVILETTGALLEGVWGNGHEDFAVLRLVGDGPAAALTPDLAAVELRGGLVAAGTLTDAAALRRLAEVRVRGLIVGGLAASLLPAVSQVDFPVLVVEGFGRRGFSAPAYALLAGNAGREAWLNAVTRDRFRGRRPEMIVPLPPTHTPPPPPVDGETLAAGQRVRVVRGPEMGRVGVVQAVGDRPAPAPSGVRALLVSVTLEGAREPVDLPAPNLEILQ